MIQTATARPAGSELAWTIATRLFRVPSGDLVRTFTQAIPRRATFSPDGALVLGGPLLIDVATGADRVLPIDGDVSLFLGDGRIVGQAASGAMQIWCAQ